MARNSPAVTANEAGRLGLVGGDKVSQLLDDGVDELLLVPLVLAELGEDVVLSTRVLHPVVMKGGRGRMEGEREGERRGVKDANNALIKPDSQFLIFCTRATQLWFWRAGVWANYLMYSFWMVLYSQLVQNHN